MNIPVFVESNVFTFIENGSILFISEVVAYACT